MPRLYCGSFYAAPECPPSVFLMASIPASIIAPAESGFLLCFGFAGISLPAPRGNDAIGQRERCLTVRGVRKPGAAAYGRHVTSGAISLHHITRRSARHITLRGICV